MNKTVFISDRLSGVPKEGQLLISLNTIQKKLEDKGYRVIRSVTLDATEELPWEESIRKDITALMKCDELHLGYDWHDNRTSTILRGVAMSLGINIVYH